MKNLIYIACCSTLLCSCGIMKDYERPADLTQGIDSLYRDTTANSVAQADTTNFGNTPWQEVFADP